MFIAHWLVQTAGLRYFQVIWSATGDTSLHKLTAPRLRSCDLYVQVWVPYAEGSLPEGLTDAAFDELASRAASKAAAQRKQQLPYQAPAW